MTNILWLSTIDLDSIVQKYVAKTKLTALDRSLLSETFANNKFYFYYWPQNDSPCQGMVSGLELDQCVTSGW